MQGSCLCQKVKFKFDQLPNKIAHCHCSQCRKFTGAAFAAFATIEHKTFTWLKGEDLVATFASSDFAHRGFCTHCGSGLYYRLNGNDQPYEIALGSLDDADARLLKLNTDANIFYSERNDWALNYHKLTCIESDRE